MKKAVWIASGVCLATVIGMLLTLLLAGRTKQPEFVPPAFESAAEAGMPTVMDSSWTQLHRDGMDFSAHLCGKLTLNRKAADVYFTNDSGNTVWLKLRILDENDQILAETGLLKPDEYVKTVHFTKIPQPGDIIKLKIMAYEPETYYSAGAVTLYTTVE